MEKVLWKEAEPVGQTLASVLYGFRVQDTDGLLLDAVTMADLTGEPGMESTPLLDALVVQVNRMSLVMERLLGIMNAAAPEGMQVLDVTIGDPVRQKGTMLVPVLMALSDGQTVTIWFHNPDSSPNKITPMDDLVSWKWMLNRQDITIAVAPERGKDLNIREVARRIMKLAGKNAAAFAKANAKAAARAEEEAALDTQISGLTAELSDLTHKLEVARQAHEDQANQPAGPMKITDPANYSKILAGDHSLAITYQDQLDEYFAGRQENVRTALRNLGWAGERFNSLEKSGCKLETSLYTASARRFVVGVTWNVRDGSDQQIFSYTDDLTLSAEEIAARLDASVASVQPATPSRLVITDPAVYARILAGDESLAIAHQDELDTFFGGRVVEIRNGLRELGWDGERFKSLSKDGAILYQEVEAVGAGRNIVGVTLSAKFGDEVLGSYTDDLTMTPLEIAVKVDGFLANKRAAEVEPETTNDPDPDAETSREKDPAEEAREIQAEYNERAAAIRSELVDAGFVSRDGNLERGEVQIFYRSGDIGFQQAMNTKPTPVSRFSVRGAQGKGSGDVDDDLTKSTRDVAVEILAIADQLQAAAAEAAASVNPLALKDNDGNLLTTDVAIRANAVIEKLIAKGFTITSASEGIYNHTLTGPFSHGLFMVGVDPFYPKSMEFDLESTYDHDSIQPSSQSNDEIAEAIAVIDWNSAYAEVSSGGALENSFAGDGPLHGKPLEFARAAMMVERGASRADLNVHYGDFTDSTSMGLLDDASGNSSVIGITAQIHAGGTIYARVSIDEKGAVTLLRGSAGRDVLGQPSDSAEVASMLRTAIQEDAAAKAEAAKARRAAEKEAKPPRVLVGDVRKAYDSLGYIRNDLIGHTREEFALASVDYLKQKIAEAQDLIARGLPKRGTVPDLAGMIVTAQALVERQAEAAAAYAAAAAERAQAEQPSASSLDPGATSTVATPDASAANDDAGPLDADELALLASLKEGSYDISTDNLVKRLEDIARRAAGTQLQEEVDAAVSAYSVAVVAQSAARIDSLTK